MSRQPSKRVLSEHEKEILARLEWAAMGFRSYLDTLGDGENLAVARVKLDEAVQHVRAHINPGQ